MLNARTGSYFLGLYVAYLVVLYARAGIDDSGHPLYPIARVTLPIIELGLAYVLVAGVERFAPRRSRVQRGIRLVLAAGIALAIGSIYVAQTYSLHLSGNFISVLALENRAEGRLVRTWSCYLSFALALLWWFTLALHLGRSVVDDPLVINRVPFRWLSTLIAMLVAQGWLYSAQAGSSRLEVDYRQTPVSSLIHNSLRVYLARHDFDDGRPSRETLDVANLGASGYPFERRVIYRASLPFERRNTLEASPNVIVIFTEGLSARFIDAYKGEYPDLTPNIDKLAVRAMRVDNYFNHTAATYRGLQGQMVSGYPGNGGAAEDAPWRSGGDALALAHTQYQSIPRLLGEAGYDTYFFSPHPDNVALNALIRSLGFSKVFTLESALEKQPALGEKLTNGSLSDRDIFGEVSRFLADRRHSRQHRPFFVGMYNIGTHAFFDVDGDGVRYGDGSNEVLNRIHNFDTQLGTFLDAFFNSAYARNTILVLTADHATFPEPAFRAIAGSGYKPYFIDRIPLLIDDPAYSLPASFDAAGATSIDFAPTLMHLMGIKKAHNSFLGNSIFEKGVGTFGFAAIGRDYFASDSSGVFAEADLPAAYRAEFARRKAAVTLYYRLEIENRIFIPAP